MDKKQFVKVLINTVAGMAVGSVVMGIINENTPKDMTPVNKVLFGVGAFIVTTLITDTCVVHVAELIDAFGEGFNPIISKEV